MKYRPEIDGLRAVAVSAVLLGHAGWLSGGFLGVDIFFVISGYLITTIIISELASGKFLFRNFYERRVRRIAPALLVIMLASLPFTLLYMNQEQLDENTKAIPWIILSASNFYYYLQSGYFQLAVETKPFIHTWSLAVEEQYYIVFPILLLIAFKINRKLVLPLCLVIFVASLATAQWMLGVNTDANYYMITSRAWELMIGSIGAYYVFRRGLPKASNIFGLVGVLSILASVFLINSETPFPSFYGLPLTFGTLLVILFSGGDTVVKRALSLKPVVFIGAISYSLYLWHQPIYAFMRLRLPHVGFSDYVLAIEVAVVLSFLSYKFIETPFRNRQKMRYRNVIFAVFVMIAALMAFWALERYHVLKPIEPAAATAVSAERLQAKKAHDWNEFRPKCQYAPNRGKADEYLKKWKCAPNVKGSVYDSSYQPLSVMIFGDSHADDIARGFTENGYAVYQVSGNDCPITPSKTQPAWRTKGCNQLRDFAKEVIRKNNIPTVILTNRFEENDPAFVQSIEEWASEFDGVIALGPRPKFQNFDTTLVNYSRFKNYPAPTATFPNRIENASAQADAIRQAGATYFDESELFCEINVCGFRDKDGNLMMIDDDHYTLTGSKEVVSNLIRQLCKSGEKIDGLKCSASK